MSWIRTTVIRTAAAAALLMIVAPPAAPAQECGNWTVTRAQPFSDMEAVAWGNGRFAGVGVGTATSFDGFAWVVPPTSGMAAGWAAADYRDVAFAGGRFVAVGATAVSGAWTGDILWSNDGVNWQRAVIPAVDIVRIVAYGNARWIAAATGTILWSDDGAAWQQAAVTGTIGGAGIEAVVWTGDHWLAVGSWQGNQWSATSDDGTAWRAGAVRRCPGRKRDDRCRRVRERDPYHLRRHGLDRSLPRPAPLADGPHLDRRALRGGRRLGRRGVAPDQAGRVDEPRRVRVDLADGPERAAGRRYS